MTDDAKAVRAVLRDRPIHALELQRITGLPHERLYAALVKLENIGLARVAGMGEFMPRGWAAA
jgi:sugar-specific transcriptional regulator TrmB